MIGGARGKIKWATVENKVGSVSVSLFLQSYCEIGNTTVNITTERNIENQYALACSTEKRDELAFWEEQCPARPTENKI